MIIKRIAFGDANEAFIEDRLAKGFNIIYSDDNNKGKTILMQSALYAIGNEPTFPESFHYENYYHYVQIELDNGNELEACRKGNSFILKIQNNISIIDGISELKRLLNRNGFYFPVIIKDNALKMVDPVLLYQIFFVGQDEKNPANIFKAGYYKKDDFWNVIYALAGLESTSIDTLDQDEIKAKIDRLNEEKKVLKSRNKILKGHKNSSLDLVSQQRSNEAFENKIKKIASIQNRIIELTKVRNRAASRRLVNERTLNEINSLNRSDVSGSLYCIDCGSDRIGYRSGDKSYTFDITDLEMRRNIKESIQDKIASYDEEVQVCNQQLNDLQRQLQVLLKEEDLNLETVLMYKDDIVDAAEDDTRLVEIDNEIKRLKASLTLNNKKSQNDAQQRDELKKVIVSLMNSFYKKVDPNGTLIFDDIFAKRNSTYSGSEGTEFFLSRLYALALSLKHQYPIMMDYFRDGELSSEKEEIVLKEFALFKNQIIFTATLKDEELGKYEKKRGIKAINYSDNTDSHILDVRFNRKFRNILKAMMIDLK